MIVAHPDDETIFGYTQLIQRIKLADSKYCPDWTVLCLTNGDNEMRASEFRRVVHQDYCAIPVIWDYADQWNAPIDLRCTDRLSDFLAEGKFDHIVTHNSEGEYGHTQHASLHRIVKALVAQNLLVFGCGVRPLPFDILVEKLLLLKRYESQCQLQAWDWYDSQRPENTLMKFIMYESLVQVY